MIEFERSATPTPHSLANFDEMSVYPTICHRNSKFVDQSSRTKKVKSST